MTFRLALGLLAPLLVAAAPAPRLLPQPAEMQVRDTGFSLSQGAVVVTPPGDAGAANAAQRLRELLGTSGLKLTGQTKAAPTVRFVRAGGMKPEAYTLETGEHGATITASDDSGLFYGAVTLWQLATQTGTPGEVAGVSITDAPRFAWRGILLDSARHYQSPAYIRRMIDWLAANKLNTLHWHLVDDQSWRLEIKAYPKLTQVAAFRRPSVAPGAPALPVTGGFYTQTEVRQIVAYAQARGVTIVPEIEMPGHATAALLAYPRVGLGTPPKASDMGHWGVFPWIYKPSDETFRFLETVLTETMALFPSRYIHIGGDEPVFDRWKADPSVQAQMKSLGLKDEQALHGWFMARMAGFLDQHGRRAIGWDEILDGGAPQSTAIMSWRGTDGAIKAARGGHDTVLSPSPDLYIDHVQGTGPNEPPGRGGVISLKDVYNFDPAPASLTPEQRGHILGVQANAWSEHIRTEARNAWMTFPRASAIAELTWSAKRDDYRGFLTRLVPQLDRMRLLGLTAADSAFNVTLSQDRAPDEKHLSAKLTNQSGLPIRYTIDGSDPAKGQPYDNVFGLVGPLRLRAVAMLDGRALPGALDTVVDAASALTRTSRQLETCTPGAILDLEDDYPAQGPRAHFVVNILKPCWVWKDAPIGQGREFRIDVGQVPFNFEVGKDRDAMEFDAPKTPAGEFEIREAGCDGPVIATFPLAVAARNPGVTSLTAPIRVAAARADLCITYTARGPDPLWAIDQIAIVPR
jgi:hexosaminidase